MAAPVDVLSKFVWCLLIIFVLFCNTSGSDRTLKLTHVIFRHGNRSPIRTYPSDPYQEDSWPQGFGQLTQEGMRQQHELGQWFRKRYMVDRKFLNLSYVRTEIHIRSTAFDRTLMSAESNLAGLYPPDGQQMWDKQLAWQPIPVFTTPKTDDSLFGMEYFDCPRREELQKELKRLHKDYINKSKDFFDSVAKHGGFNLKNVTYHNFSVMADAIYFEMADGRKLPDWATTDVVERLLAMRDYTYISMAQLGDDYFKLSAGPLFSEIVTHLRNKTGGTEAAKMYMYSAHDDNVAWTLQSLNVFNNLVPPPASCVLIELYQEGDKSYSVDVLFRNNTQKEPIKLQMQGTSGHCTLDHFYKITRNILLNSDIKTACKAQKNQDDGGFLPKTWNTGLLPFSAGRRAFQWLAVLFMLIIFILFVSARKWARFLRNVNNNVKLRVFMPSSVPAV